MDEKEKVIIELNEEELEEKQTKKTLRVLVFSLGEENYCLDIRQAKEVARLSEITRAPGAPQFIAGLINLRGEVIALVDIRCFLGLKAAEISLASRVIISDVTGSSLGILADAVKGVFEIEEESIQPPIATLKEELLKFTKGQIQFGNDILILLDLEKILRCEAIEELKKGGK